MMKHAKLRGGWRPICGQQEACQGRRNFGELRSCLAQHVGMWVPRFPLVQQLVKSPKNIPKLTKVFTTCSLLAGMQVPGFSGTTSPSCTILFFHQWFISRFFSWGKQVHHGTSQACFGSKQMVRYPMISPYRTSFCWNPCRYSFCSGSILKWLVIKKIN